MTYQQAIDRAAEKLGRVCDNPKLEAQLLVCHACRIKQPKLLAHPDNELSAREEKAFEIHCSSRLEGKPFAYITGTKEFWSLEFIVNQHVLIPRPETEQLVEMVLELIPDRQCMQILDLGTGSGAIAVAIAKERKYCSVVAADISRPALKVAKQNAARHDVDITFVHSDWFTSLNRHRYDIIVSNPPYVAGNDPYLDRYVARYEPRLAWISGKSGLEDIEQIILHAGQFLNRQGCLLIEHGFNQGAAVRRLFRQNGFIQIQTCQDLSGQERVSSARTP